MNPHNHLNLRTLVLSSLALCSLGMTNPAFSWEHNRHDAVRGHARARIEHHARYSHVREYHPGFHHFAGFTAGFSFPIPVPSIAFGSVVVSLPGVFRTFHCGDRPYYLCNGVFYTRHPYGYEVVRAPRVRFIPDHARRVVIGGIVYFEHDDYYYCYRDGYYEMCEPPVVVGKGTEKTVVMIENSNGSRTPVEMEPLGANQWKGPRGEIYDGLPTEEQLKNGYGF